MAEGPSAANAEDGDAVRTAEVVSALSMATDLAQGLPWEHGLHSAVVAMRLAEDLRVDGETALQTYYGCLLFYVGCTADAEVVAARFPAEDALVKHFTPAMMGSGVEIAAAIIKALGNPDLPAPIRLGHSLARLPAATRGHRAHLQAMCEVAEMLAHRLGMPSMIKSLFADFPSRWDGQGPGSGHSGESIPLAVRIIHVARDGTFHATIGGARHAVDTIESSWARPSTPPSLPLSSTIPSSLTCRATRSGPSFWRTSPALTGSCVPGRSMRPSRHW